MAGMDLQAEYDNRARVAGSAELLSRWQRDAAAYREAAVDAELNLAYGPGKRERLDLFRPAGGGDAPLVIFIHGGYWQSLDRSFGSHFAHGLVSRGIAVAMPSYDLAPAVPLNRIADQMRSATSWLFRRLRRRPLLMGHSAGGQLTALLMATDWRSLQPGLPQDLVPAGLPISGVFELEPLMPTTIAKALRLRPEDAKRLSPRWMKPPSFASHHLVTPGAGLHCVVGAAESGEFIRQSRDFATAWGGSFEALPGLNHFTVLDPLLDPGSALVARAAAMATALAPG